MKYVSIILTIVICGVNLGLLSWLFGTTPTKQNNPENIPKSPQSSKIKTSSSNSKNKDDSLQTTDSHTSIKTNDFSPQVSPRKTIPIELRRKL